MPRNVRIGLVGTGFGRRVMLPAFAACDGAELAAVCSGRRGNAEATAKLFDIPGIYDDYEAMLEHEKLDLVAITTPPHLHWPMTRAAAERGVHVLCEKPTALDVTEARHMRDAAVQAGILHLIDHELRFHPTLVQLKALIGEGYLGPPESVSFSVQWRYPLVLNRPWNWWFDADKGGGLLGALGSHQIDLVRWAFDTEFRRVNGFVHSFVKERPLPDSKETRPVTSDNFCAFTAKLANGAYGTVTLDATARVLSERNRWTIAFHGRDGSLVFDGRGRLWGMKGEDKTELTQPAPEADVPGLPEGAFPTGFAYFAKAIVDALRRGERQVAGAATFEDGVRVQAALDAVRASHREGRWIRLDGAPRPS